MKKLLLIAFFYCYSVSAQNLVPNWSFETYTACPTSGNEAPPPWTMPTSGSADYFNPCAPSGSNSVPYHPGGGFQNPKDGFAFEGVFLLNGFGWEYREYIQAQLTNSLTSGNCYYVEFYTNLYNESKYATNNIAANFSSIPYGTTGTATVLNAPQHITRYGNPIIKDTMNWVQVSGLYVAGGGEKYICLGNFKTNANTDTMTINTSMSVYWGTYCYFDAVSVYSINPTGTLPWTYSNTSVAVGDSVYIGNTVGGTFTSDWYNYSGGFIKSGAGIYVKPVTTSTYVVQFTVCGVPRSDTLTVTVTGTGFDELRFNNDELRISPNPNNGVFDLEILSKEFIIADSELRIVNVLGQEIRKEKLLSKKQKINLEELVSGVYYLQLVKQGKALVAKKILKE